MHNDCIKILERKGIKPTANRIIVAKTLMHSSRPLSMTDIENRNLSMDKSSIFRTLMLFKENGMVHVIEDGSGAQKYELCTADHDLGEEDQHVHFFCEVCQKTFCMTEIKVPDVMLPDDFHVHSINYMIKGVCPNCRK